MNSTKRKFNALIRGISTSRPSPADSALPTPDDHTSSPPQAPLPRVSTTRSQSSMAIDSELLAKRRRLGLPDKTPPTATNSSSPGKPSTSISNIVLRKWSGDPASKGPPTAAGAKYCPSDRAELLKRLVTFQELTDWTPKPDRVNEVEWAKRGWICSGKEKVRCVLCSKELVVKVNRKEVDGKEVSVLVPSEIEEALVQKYTELIVESHLDDCLWRKRGCEDSLLRISFTNPSTNFASLRGRYDDLCSRKSFLPYEFNLRLPKDLDLDIVLQGLPPDFFTSPPPPKDAPDATAPNRTALALALLGWQGLSNPRIGSVPNSASCHTCLRRLGLWMFKSKEVDADGKVLVPAPMDHLDPVREHRFFCPWRNPATQRLASARPNPDKDLPAWRILIQSIRNEAYLREVLEDQPLSKGRPAALAAESIPVTPIRGGAASPGTVTPVAESFASGITGDEEGDEAAREAKDKERWSRLRRVKSLFESKGAKKLRRTVSRPGTAKSTVSTASTAK